MGTQYGRLRLRREFDPTTATTTAQIVDSAFDKHGQRDRSRGDGGDSRTGYACLLLVSQEPA